MKISWQGLYFENPLVEIAFQRKQNHLNHSYVNLTNILETLAVLTNISFKIRHGSEASTLGFLSAGIVCHIFVFFLGSRHKKVAPYLIPCLDIWNIYTAYTFCDELTASSREILPIGICKGFLILFSLCVSRNFIFKIISMSTSLLALHAYSFVQGAAFNSVSAFSCLILACALGYSFYIEERAARENFGMIYTELLNLRRWKFISEKFMPAGVAVVNGTSSGRSINIERKNSIAFLEVLHFNDYFKKMFNISESPALIELFQKLAINDYYSQVPKENDFSGNLPLEFNNVDNLHDLLVQKSMNFRPTRIGSDTNKEELKLGEFTSKLVECERNGLLEAKNFEIALFEFRWDEKPCIITILHEVSELKTNEKLIVLEKHKDHLLASVSHELKTPLNSIMGNTSLLLYKQYDEDTKTLLSQIKTSADFLLNKINDILDNCQIKARKFRLNIQSFSVSEMLLEVIQLFDVSLKEKNLKLVVNSKFDADLTINTDFQRLKQVLINLVGNAMKFTFQGSISIDVETHLEGEEVIQFSVKDTGCGMTKETIQSLFQIFGTFDKSPEKANIHGVGLGLTISKQIVGKLGPEERIHVNSEPGVGSEFKFTIFKDISRNINRNQTQLKNKAFSYTKSPNQSPREPDSFFAFVTPGLAPAKKKINSKPFFSKNKNNPKSNSCLPLSFLRKLPTQKIKNLFSRPNNKKAAKTCSGAFKAAKNSQTPKALDISKDLISDDEHLDNLSIEEHFWEARVHKPYESKNVKESLTFAESTRTITSNKKIEKKIYILIVDDTPFNILILENFLKNIAELSFSIERAFNGQECLEIVEQKRRIGISFDIILMDCNMPVLDGFEASLRLREAINSKKLSDTFILGISANSDDKIKEKCLASGMNDFISKPVTQETFKTYLFKWIK